MPAAGVILLLARYIIPPVLVGRSICDTSLLMFIAFRCIVNGHFQADVWGTPWTEVVVLLSRTTRFDDVNSRLE